MTTNNNTNPTNNPETVIDSILPTTNDKRTRAIRRIERAYETIFAALDLVYGLDWMEDENFKDSPERIAKSLINERCIGINSFDTCKDILTSSSFPSDYDGIVVVANPIYVDSLCPHHFENVKYKVYMGYMPNGRSIGLSKFGRIITLFGKQPILQEDYTHQLTKIVNESISPQGVITVVYGQHNCMIARGLQASTEQWVVTSSVSGEFETCQSIKDEFFKLINIHGR